MPSPGPIIRTVTIEASFRLGGSSNIICNFDETKMEEEEEGIVNFINTSPPPNLKNLWVIAANVTNTEEPDCNTNIADTVLTLIPIKDRPTVSPSVAPSVAPSVSTAPSVSLAPSVAPSVSPSVAPSVYPSVALSVAPSVSLVPSGEPILLPRLGTASQQVSTTDETHLYHLIHQLDLLGLPVCGGISNCKSNDAMSRIHKKIHLCTT